MTELVIMFDIKYWLEVSLHIVNNQNLSVISFLPHALSISYRIEMLKVFIKASSEY